MSANDPFKSVENIVQLSSTRRAMAEPSLPVARAQPAPMVAFASWVATRDRAAAALLGGQRRLLLTGSPGTGKTVLIDHVARVLRAAGRTVIIKLADADPAPPEAGVTLFVDEADRLSAIKLRQLLDGSAGTLVLTGLASLVHRVPGGTVKLTLEPLSQTAAREYIAQWLVLNGPTELDSRAVLPLVALSGGIPRLLSTLLAAGSWLAKSSGSPVIEATHIQEAAELRSVLGTASAPEVADGGAAPRRHSRVGWSVLALLVLAGAAVPIVPWLFPAETERAPVSRELRQAEPAKAPEPVKPAAQPPAPEPSPAPAQVAPAPPEWIEVKPPESLSQAAVPPAAVQPAAPQPVVSPPVAVPALPVETVEFLLRRGREMLALEDLSAARLLFLRAAEGGSAEAEFELGRTYDPAIRSGIGAVGQSDRAEALRWYSRAAEHGNRAAERLLPRR